MATVGVKELKMDGKQHLRYADNGYIMPEIV